MSALAPETQFQNLAEKGTPPGSHRASASAGTPPPDDTTLDRMVDYLIDGYWEDVAFEGFSFADGNITVNLTDLTDAGRQLARWAFEAWEMVADLSFIEVTGSAEITFKDDGTGASGGPESVINGVNSASTVNVSTNWLDIYGTGIDSYSFSTYMHEIGHALGLGHMGPYDGNAVYGRDNVFVEDSVQLSIMSYFDQDQNFTTNASVGAPVTPMLVDIIAIQSLYGAPTASSATSGDTTWGVNSNLEGYLGTLFDVLDGATPPPGFLTEDEDLAFTIYDVDGIDTLDLSRTDDSNRVSLVGGTFSDVAGRIGNLAIARDTVVEKLILGGGADTVTGNDADNEIYGRGGNDRIEAGGGDDMVFGATGRDEIYGGDGSDTLFGGSGNDTVFAGNDADIVYGGSGRDMIGGGGGDDRLGGADGDDLLTGGADNDTIYAADGLDAAYGGSGNDMLFGGDGSDTLGGAGGDDTLYGGNDHDEIWGSFGNDNLVGGGGDDTLGAGDGDDMLVGANGNDGLYGGDGNDTIDGGDGDDLLFGGSGADVFIFGTDDGADQIFTFDAGERDILRLDDALWSGVLSKEDVVDAFAEKNGAGNVVFDFGSTSFELVDVTSAAGLADTIEMF